VDKRQRIHESFPTKTLSAISFKKDGLNKVKNTMQLTNDGSQLKDIFEQAIIEVMEDAAIIHAIQEGEKSGITSRAEVFKILGSNT